MFTTQPIQNTTSHEEIDLEQLYSEQSAAEALYDLAVTYKNFGFRDKAIIEFYRLCDLRTECANNFATKLVPMLFN